MAITAAVEPLQVRGRFLTTVVVPIAGAPNEAFYAALDALLRRSPQFFANAPLVLDIARADGLDRQDEFCDLLHNLRLRKLSPIGIQNATERQSAEASAAGLTTLPEGRDAPLERKSRPSVDAPQWVEPPRATMLISEPVRSGQRIVAEGGDLVVVASVSSGAELIARGNVHIYGRLRGRALAGVHGDTTARIFCQSLEAELIAIAGLYKTSEDLGNAVTRQRVHAFLDDDTLRIDVLK